MSKRKDIRTAIATALKGQTTAGQSVLTSRHKAIFSEVFPIILVYAPDESADETRSRSPMVYSRTMNVTVSALLLANDDIDDALDDIARQIETAVAADPTFGGLAMNTLYKKFFSEVDITGESQYGATHLTFEVTYIE